jgi:hypothetical protein
VKTRAEMRGNRGYPHNAHHTTRTTLSVRQAQSIQAEHSEFKYRKTHSFASMRPNLGKRAVVCLRRIEIPGT